MNFLKLNEKEVIDARNLRDGYVYILEKSNKHVKIGKTKNPITRIKTLSMQAGEKFQRVFISDLCKNYSELEIRMHEIFKYYRCVGEWFNVDFNEAVATFKHLHIQPPFTDEENKVWRIEEHQKEEKMMELLSKFMGFGEKNENYINELADVVTNVISKKFEELIEKNPYLIKPTCRQINDIIKYIKEGLGPSCTKNEYELVELRSLIILGGEVWEDIPAQMLATNMNVIDESITLVKTDRKTHQVSMFV